MYGGVCRAGCARWSVYGGCVGRGVKGGMFRVGCEGLDV